MRTEPSFSEESEPHFGGTNGEGDASETSLLSDYRQRYGLSVDPFVDDPHFPFYQGAQRRQVLEQLLHFCQFSNNLLVVTGDYGVGKTRMAQALIDSLDDADDIGFIEGQINSDLDSILADVCSQFELASQEDFVAFCRKKTEQAGLVVLIIDNAHHLSDEVVADLLGLLQDNSESRLHIVLFAEPYLLDRLEAINAPNIVLTDFLLEKFSLVEAVDYLNFRMEMADYLGPEVFTEHKVESWWRQSQGQLLLLHESAQEKLLESVSIPSRTRSYGYHKRGVPVPYIVGASALVGVLLFGLFYFGSDSSSKTSTKVSSPIPVPLSPQFVSNPAQAPVTQAASSTSVLSSIAANTAPSSSLAYSAASSLSAQNAAEETQVAIKQSAVPLVQTNDFQVEKAPKSVKSNVVSSARPVQKAQASSELAKVATKVKGETSVAAAETKSAQVYSEQEKTILGWGGAGFTIQLMGLSNEKAAHDFLAAQPNRKDLLLFKSRRAGKDWFVVVTGNYPSSAKARQAIQNLPELQKKAAPWQREIKVVQQEIKQR